MVLRPFARGYTCTPTPLLFTSRALGDLSLCLLDWEQEKSDITLWSWLKGFSFFFSITFIEIAVCYWPRESQEHWIVSKFFQNQKGGRGNSKLYWTKHLSLSCCTSHYRSMQEVQLDKHVKLVDSPGIVMDNSNSDSAVILRNCVKVRFHSVVQEWPTVIFSCLRASSPGRSGGGAGKGRRASCNYVSGIWIPPLNPQWLSVD